MEAKVQIVDVYRITGIGIVPVGKVVEGTLKVGMKIGIDGKIMEIKSIEMHHKQLTEAHEGDNIGFALRNGDYDLLKKIRGKEAVFSTQVSPEIEHI